MLICVDDIESWHAGFVEVSALLESTEKKITPQFMVPLLHVIRFVFLTFDALGRDSDAEENLEDRIATKQCHRVPSYSSIGRSVPIRQRRTRGRFLELLVLPSCGCKFDAAIQEKILQKRDELAQQKAGSLLVAYLIRHVICCIA